MPSKPKRVKREKWTGPNPVIAAELARALGHPLRVEILEFLVREKGSAKSIAKALHLPLGNISYHLNNVLDRQCHVVKVVETQHGRGAMQTFYRIDQEAIFGKVNWPKVPEPFGSALEKVSIAAFLAGLAAAIESGSLAEHDDATLLWRPAPVDWDGWLQIQKAMAEANEKVAVAIMDSTERLNGATPMNAIVGMAAFEVPPPDSVAGERAS